MGNKGGKNLRCHVLQRHPAGVAGEVQRLGRLQRIPTLRLAQVAPDDMRLAGNRIDELDHARPADPLPDPLRHLLHHKAQCRLIRCPLGLTQQAGAGALPCPGHASQHLGKLLRRVLRERLVGLHLILVQRLTQGPRPRLQPVESLRVKPGNMDRIGLDEPQIQRIRRLLAMRLGQPGMALGVQANVENRRRPAPVGVAGRRADRDQRPVAKAVKDTRRIDPMPRRDGAHGAGGHRHRFRHRQIKPHQPLQAFRPPAMRRRRDLRRGRDQGKFRHGIVFLHCSTRCSAAAYPEKTVNQA